MLDIAHATLIVRNAYKCSALAIRCVMHAQYTYAQRDAYDGVFVTNEAFANDVMSAISSDLLEHMVDVGDDVMLRHVQQQHVALQQVRDGAL